MNRPFSIYLDLIRFLATCLAVINYSNSRLIVDKVRPLSINRYTAYREQNFSKWFLTDYLLAGIVFLNFVGMRRIAFRFAPHVYATERPMRDAAAYTLSILHPAAGKPAARPHRTIRSEAPE